DGEAGGKVAEFVAPAKNLATFRPRGHLGRRLSDAKYHVGIHLNTEHAEVIRKARAGDLEAFRMIHEEYGRRIVNFIYRMVDSREDAEDLSQEVFLIVFHELRRLKDEGRFESWIYRIARNEVYQAYRKKRGHPSADTSPRGDGTVSGSETMTAQTHPEDLSPFVYGRRDHEEHAAICAHLELCAQCRAEVEEWRSLTALFRSPELEIDVSPGQWRRIAERLEA